MKNFIFVYAFQLLFQDVFSNDILSKFRQNGYKVKNIRMELMRYDENSYNIFEIKGFKYNRTTPAHNITFNMKIETKDKLEVLVQTQKFLSNEYRHFPIRFQVNLKRAFDTNAIGLHDVVKCGNITTFYFHKETTYHACNYVIDETRLPPLIPNGLYRHEMQLLYSNKEIATIHLYGEVYTPIEYPKK